MTQPFARIRCEECRSIARALRVAWRVDHRELRIKLRDVAASSGRDFRVFGISWVFSVVTMPDEEMKTVLQSHYPRVAAAMHQREEHETISGHSIALSGSWMLSWYGLDEPE